MIVTATTAGVSEAKTIEVGMPFEQAEALIKESGGRETMLDMEYSGPTENTWKLFFLPDGRHISVVFKKEGNQKIVNLSSFLINGDVPKADPNYYTSIEKDAQEIEVNSKERQSNIRASSVPGPVPENLTCAFNTDCGWEGGFPVSKGGCGCFSKGYIESVKKGMKEGIYKSQPLIQCEAPPWLDTFCLCIEGACKGDVWMEYDDKIIPQSQAMDIAKKLCEQEGYEWKDVSIDDGGRAWVIRTCGRQDGGNAEIRIDKSTGEVLQKDFNPE